MPKFTLRISDWSTRPQRRHLHQPPPQCSGTPWKLRKAEDREDHSKIVLWTRENHHTGEHTATLAAETRPDKIKPVTILAWSWEEVTDSTPN